MADLEGGISALTKEPTQPALEGNGEPDNNVVLANPMLGVRRLTENSLVTGIA